MSIYKAESRPMQVLKSRLLRPLVFGSCDDHRYYEYLTGYLYKGATLHVSFNYFYENFQPTEGKTKVVWKAGLVAPGGGTPDPEEWGCYVEKPCPMSSGVQKLSFTIDIPKSGGYIFKLGRNGMSAYDDDPNSICIDEESLELSMEKMS